jgi:hypothetical protein
MKTLWTERYAQRTQTDAELCAMRELLKLTEQPDVISFAGGLPAPDVFPVKEFQEACQKVLSRARPPSPPIQHDRGLPPLARDDRAPHGALRHRRRPGEYFNYERFSASVRLSSGRSSSTLEIAS